MKHGRIAVGILLIFFGIMIQQINASYFEYQGYNPAWMSNVVRNFQMYGIDELNFREVRSTGEIPLEYLRYRNRHLPMPAFFTAALTYPAGVSEVTVRLASVFAMLISAAAFYVLVRRLFAEKVALWALALYAFTPMISYYGRMSSHEPFALMMIMLFGMVWLNWLRVPSLWRFLAMLFTGMIATVTAWSVLPFLGIFGLLTLIPGKWRQRVGILLTGLICGLMLIGVLLYYELTAPNALRELLNTASLRAAAESFDGEITIPILTGRIIDHLLSLLPVLWLLIAVIGIPFALVRATSRTCLILVGLFVAPMLYTLPLAEGTYRHDFYVIFYIPALAISGAGLMAWRVRQYPQVARVVKGLALLIILVSGAITLNTLHTTNNPLIVAGQTYETDSFIEMLQAYTEPDEYIVMQPGTLDTMAFVTGYYAVRDIHAARAENGLTDFINQHRVRPADMVYLQCGTDDLPPVSELVLSAQAANGCDFYRPRLSDGTTIHDPHYIAGLLDRHTTPDNMIYTGLRFSTAVNSRIAARDVTLNHTVSDFLEQLTWRRSQPAQMRYLHCSADTDSLAVAGLAVSAELDDTCTLYRPVLVTDTTQYDVSTLTETLTPHLTDDDVLLTNLRVADLPAMRWMNRQTRLNAPPTQFLDRFRWTRLDANAYLHCSSSETPPLSVEGLYIAADLDNGCALYRPRFITDNTDFTPRQIIDAVTGNTSPDATLLTNLQINEAVPYVVIDDRVTTLNRQPQQVLNQLENETLDRNVTVYMYCSASAEEEMPPELADYSVTQSGDCLFYTFDETTGDNL